MTDTLPGLLAARLAADPAGPLVTFYDDASGERTELSAATFANWVAKTANLLVDGLGLGAGERAVVALPVHWQSLVVVAGCWAAGVEVDFAGPADVVFAAEGGWPLETGEVVRLSLRPLGAGLVTPDPTATDYAVEVRSYGDRFTGPQPSGTAMALAGRTHADLSGAGGDSRRVLLAPDGDPLLDDRLLAASYVTPLGGGGSVVLARHADRSLLDRRAETERAELRPV